MNGGWPRRHPRTLGALLALIVFGAVTARLFVWPGLPELPRHADAIVELAGPGVRDEVAVGLGERGLAPVVIQSTVPGDDACLPAIPHARTDCFTPTPPTTRGEARYIGARGDEEDWHSVILVTTPDHAWRARLRVTRCFPGEVYVATSPLPARDWPLQIPYQWAAAVKAELFQRDC